MAYAVFVEGLREIQDFPAEQRDKVIRAAVQAINRTAERARTRAAREIGQQIAFPAGYLDPSAGRLKVGRKATRTELEAAVTARRRATSLARFATPGATPGSRTGVQVQIKPGNTKALPKAFLLRLKSGTASLETKSNLGLAIRLKPGQKLAGAYAKPMNQSGLYLLYGPSVDQALLSRQKESGVAVDILESTADFLNDEFQRLLGL